MNKIKENINGIYRTLKENYPHEGNWWPTTDINAQNTVYMDNSSLKDNKRFEIIMGTILTQNTTWTSVDKALKNLSKYTNFSPKSIIRFIDDDLDLFKNLIKPTGYFNQKTDYLKNIAEFYISLEGRIPTRKEVLSVKGVGNETADSIMLYAYNEKEFVVDAYTKRIFTYLGYVDEKVTYLKLKRLFEDNFEGTVKDYEDYHGVIVEHAKLYYRNRPYGVNDNILAKYKI